MPNSPSWALHDVDLAHTDEDELSALIDDVIDSGKSLAFSDTREGAGILAVCIPWSAYVGLTGRALRTSKEVSAEAAKDTPPPPLSKIDDEHDGW